MNTAADHSGTIDTCPACLSHPGWQDAVGLRYAAQVIAHEAETEEDLDLSVLCQVTAELHRPGRDMRCITCGELWHTAEEFPNLGGLRCQAYIDVQLLKNDWIAGRVRRMADRLRLSGRIGVE